MRHTPEHITELADNEIFCFGSNTRGRHGKGAALQALQQFGAEYGVGEGIAGQSYAFPTLDENLAKLSECELLSSIRILRATAEALPEKVFLLTRVGCGLAGFTEDYMKSLFARIELPSNVIKPEGW